MILQKRGMSDKSPCPTSSLRDRSPEKNYQGRTQTDPGSRHQSAMSWPPNGICGTQIAGSGGSGATRWRWQLHCEPRQCPPDPRRPVYQKLSAICPQLVRKDTSARRPQERDELVSRNRPAPPARLAVRSAPGRRERFVDVALRGSVRKKERIARRKSWLPLSSRWASGADRTSAIWTSSQLALEDMETDIAAVQAEERLRIAPPAGEWRGGSHCLRHRCMRSRDHRPVSRCQCWYLLRDVL